MTTNRYLAAVILGPLLVLSWALVGFAMAVGPGHVLGAYMVGTLFAQPTLAAAWNALGPGPIAWRLPLSLAWVAALSLAFSVQSLVHPIHPAGSIIVAGALFGQWLLVQLPFWGLRVLYGVRLRHIADPPDSDRERQFGIRQVMMLTLMVAVALGAGRIALTQAAVRIEDFPTTGLLVLGFLALAGVVVNLPLIVAALLPRNSIPAVVAVLAFIALATWYELPLLLVAGSQAPITSYAQLAAINFVQAGWVLAVIAIVRTCGYGIARRQQQAPTAVK